MDNLEINRPVGFVYSKELVKASDQLPANQGRSTAVYELIKALEILNLDNKSNLNENIFILSPKFATFKDLISYHDRDYVNYLLKCNKNYNKNVTNSDSDSDSDSDYLKNYEISKFGLEYDCPIFNSLSEYISLLASSAIESSNFIISNYKKNNNNIKCIPICINWEGGRHHAKKSSSSGFCYINDIIISILELRKNFNKIMYIDLDLHHGDAVESAFSHSSNVLTLSIHRFAQNNEPPFFPGSGSYHSIGYGNGKFYSINVPLCRGANDQTLYKIYNEIILYAYEKYSPQVIFIQCGADSLFRDPCAEFSYSITGITNIIKHILDWNLPTILSGGGGYKNDDCARLWSLLTWLVLNYQKISLNNSSNSLKILNPNQQLIQNLINSLPEYDETIPIHQTWDIYKKDNYQFLPDFLISRKNENTNEYLQNIIKIIRENIDKIH